MTKWRHTLTCQFRSNIGKGGLGPPVCVGTNPIVLCGCATPDPDPASPCGFEGCTGLHHGLRWECRHPGCHPHVPTLCRCGHPVERREAGR